MKLDHPFLQLPLAFDAAALAREIEALGESAWRPHPQGFPGNSALALVSVNGDPTSDAVRGPMRPTPHLLACPYLSQTMHSIGAVWGRSRLMRLSGQAEVTPHFDTNYYWREHMRVHVPIVTQPTVQFHCGDAMINMAAGECWIFDTWRLHKVINDHESARIHLVADTVGGQRFWQHMRRCRPHDRQIPGWTPQTVRPDGIARELDYESYNLPLVMSPWEVREHIAFLMSETRPDENLRAFGQNVVGPFVRDWQALWAKYGDSGQGLVEYEALRDGLRAQFPAYQKLLLVNGIPLVKTLNTIVIHNLVASDSASDIETRDQPARRAPAASTGRPPAPVPSPSSWSAPWAGKSVQIRHGSVAASVASAPVAHSSLAPGNRPALAAVATPASLSFDRPVVIVSAPRSGSTLLFETLARAPNLCTIGGESHRAIESVPALRPASRGFESNCLGAGDATPAVVMAVLRNFSGALRDRNGASPASGSVRLLEKTPKNALRLPFLQKVFPDARYVWLYREPREVLASMLEAWRSGRFRTYPDLPGWQGLDWSLLLIPGWRGLSGAPLEEIVARQWAVTTDLMLDALEAMPSERIVRIRYDSLTAQPQREMQRLSRELDLDWDIALEELPPSRHTLTKPESGKWRKHEATVEKMLASVGSTHDRVERFFRG